MFKRLMRLLKIYKFILESREKNKKKEWDDFTLL